MMPWFAAKMPDLDFDDIYYYIKPTENQVDAGTTCPTSIKNTYEKLGIPEAERKYLAGVTAQYESEVVYHRNREDLERHGVLFCDMDTALREYPDIVRRYFGTVIPPNDNKFAALNSAVWSGGSFIYVPPGVKVDMPLQAYFRINAENMGQFERTLIIADEGAKVHYIEGCSAPVYSTDSLHSAVVELVALPRRRITYTTIQNWSNNVYNLVTKRARAEAEAPRRVDRRQHRLAPDDEVPVRVPDGPEGLGRGPVGRLRGRRPASRTPGRRWSTARPRRPRRSSRSRSPRTAASTTYRGLVHVDEGATARKAFVRCDALILDEDSVSETKPYMEVGERDAADRPRGDGLQGRRRPALLPDEPRPHREPGDGHDRQRLHRAGHPHAADGVRGRVEPPDRAADGGLRRLMSVGSERGGSNPWAASGSARSRARADA